MTATIRYLLASHLRLAMRHSLPDAIKLVILWMLGHPGLVLQHPDHSVTTCLVRPRWSIACCRPVSLATSNMAPLGAHYRAAQSDWPSKCFREILAFIVGLSLAQQVVEVDVVQCLAVLRHRGAGQILAVAVAHGRYLGRNQGRPGPHTALVKGPPTRSNGSSADPAERAKQAGPDPRAGDFTQLRALKASRPALAHRYSHFPIRPNDSTVLLSFVRRDVGHCGRTGGNKEEMRGNSAEDGREGKAREKGTREQRMSHTHKQTGARARTS